MSFSIGVPPTSTPYFEPEDRKETSVVEESKRAEKEIDMCLYKDESYDYRINDDGTMLGRITKVLTFRDGIVLKTFRCIFRQQPLT